MRKGSPWRGFPVGLRPHTPHRYRPDPTWWVAASLHDLRVSATFACRSRRQLREADGCAPVDLRYRVGVVFQRCRAPAGVAKPRGGVPEVEAFGEHLACRVMPDSLDVEVDPCRHGEVPHAVGYPVRVPRPRTSSGTGSRVRSAGPSRRTPWHARTRSAAALRDRKGYAAWRHDTSLRRHRSTNLSTAFPGKSLKLQVRSSSLKEWAGVKGGFGLRFCGGIAFTGHGGMALWLVFPDRCRVRASGLAGQGPGGARPRCGAAGVLDALVREPIMAGAGKGRGRVHGLCGYERPIAGCPAGRPAGCLHPFGCAPAWRAGGHGAVRVQGRAGPITFPFPPPRGWCRLRRGAQDFAAARPSGPAAHAAWLVARRMCPSRMP